MIDLPYPNPCLIQTCATNKTHSRHVIAIGDGSNDLPMMGTAGLAMAYHVKTRLREQATVAMNTVGLDRLLEVLTMTNIVRIKPIFIIINRR